MLHAVSHLPPLAAQGKTPGNSRLTSCRNTRQRESSPGGRQIVYAVGSKDSTGILSKLHNYLFCYNATIDYRTLLAIA